MRRIGMAVVVLLVCGVMQGCVTRTPRDVSADELATLQKSVQHVEVGMPKDAVLASIPKVGYRNLIGTTKIDDGILEEWLIEANTLDENYAVLYGHRVVAEMFQRYFYFVNGKLADMSTQPLQYRDRRDLIVEWRNR